MTIPVSEQRKILSQSFRLNLALTGYIRYIVHNRLTVTSIRIQLSPKGKIIFSPINHFTAVKLMAKNILVPISARWALRGDFKK